jgi:hypothetical protein
VGEGQWLGRSEPDRASNAECSPFTESQDAGLLRNSLVGCLGVGQRLFGGLRLWRRFVDIFRALQANRNAIKVKLGIRSAKSALVHEWEWYHGTGKPDTQAKAVCHTRATSILEPRRIERTRRSSFFPVETRVRVETPKAKCVTCGGETELYRANIPYCIACIVKVDQGQMDPNGLSPRRKT